MAFSYFPHTEEDIRQMLERIGVGTLEELYSDVPSNVIYKGEYDLPSSMSEIEVRNYFEGLAALNSKMKVYVGQGAYDHYAPAVIPYITSRSEFLTAYTPYQPEISQGTLRYIFEWQSMICTLTGMDCANASMYDGATAAAEAAIMSIASTKKKSRILLSEGLLPSVVEVIKTYCKFHGIEVGMVGLSEGRTSLKELLCLLEGADAKTCNVAGIIVPGINKYGIIEDLTGFAEAIHAVGGLLTVYSDPSTLGVLKTPAAWGADICCGDGQSLGIPLCYGGPYVGFLACKSAHLRKLPGRIVGQTTDVDGKRAFVLTLQAREQHIRREKATSNICSNQSLMALYVTVYLSLMGPVGLRKVNDLCYEGAHYLYEKLLGLGCFEAAFDAPFLKEFVVKTSLDIAALQQALADAGYFAAYQVGEGLVTFCVTENHSKAEIDAMVEVIKNYAL